MFRSCAAEVSFAGSNHLRAFNEQLPAQGVTYVPQVISQAEWNAIANTPQETCGG